MTARRAPRGWRDADAERVGRPRRSRGHPRGWPDPAPSERASTASPSGGPGTRLRRPRRRPAEEAAAPGTSKCPAEAGTGSRVRAPRSRRTCSDAMGASSSGPCPASHRAPRGLRAGSASAAFGGRRPGSRGRACGGARGRGAARGARGCGWRLCTGRGWALPPRGAAPGSQRGPGFLLAPRAEPRTRAAPPPPPGLARTRGRRSPAPSPRSRGVSSAGCRLAGRRCGRRERGCERTSSRAALLTWGNLHPRTRKTRALPSGLLPLGMGLNVRDVQSPCVCGHTRAHTHAYTRARAHTHTSGPFCFE